MTQTWTQIHKTLTYVFLEIHIYPKVPESIDKQVIQWIQYVSRVAPNGT